MFSISKIVSCNFPYLPLKARDIISSRSTPIISQPSDLASSHEILLHSAHREQFPHITSCSSTSSREAKGLALKREASPEDELAGDGNGGKRKNWTTSILLFCLWIMLLYYIFVLSPNGTPSRDMDFLLKLFFLKGNDGFKMNQVLVSLWWIMGLWPLVYSMLLLPSSRSPKGSIPVWPFLLLSFAFGVYALLPYFFLRTLVVLPSPPVKEPELKSWPLNFLESKMTSCVVLAGGLGLFGFAALAYADSWVEFYRYFLESRLINITCVDFSLLSAFAPFWVYNDMTYRKWLQKGFWLLPLSVIPFLGPVLYLILRPSVRTFPSLPEPTISEQE